MASTTVTTGEPESPPRLEDLIKEYGSGFDIIVDDSDCYREICCF